MIRSNLRTHQSPLARAMGEIGDGWMLLTLWASLNGITRFEEMLQYLGVARNILSDRLRRLVEIGLLEKKPISTNSKRYEYVPTHRAQTLREPLRLLETWGKHECPMQLEAKSA